MSSSIKDRILELADSKLHVGIIGAFKRLDSLVGLEQAKKQIYEYAMINLYRKSSGRSGSLMNLVLSGPPGVGKTTLAKAIGELYIATGIVSNGTVLNNLDQVDKNMINTHLTELSHNLYDLRHKYARRLIHSPDEYDYTIKQFFESLDYVEASRLILNKKTYVSTGQFVVTDRQGLISSVIGGTAIKTTEILNRALGGVLFIDEAYSLGIGSDNDFGPECLTTINNFITEHPGQIIIILAGYKDLIEKNLFSLQPGLESRFLPQIEMTSYSTQDLVTMFRQKMNQYKLPPVNDLVKLFDSRKQQLAHFGRDIDTLALMTEIVWVTENSSPGMIELHHIEKGFKRMKSHTQEAAAHGMYI